MMSNINVDAICSEIRWYGSKDENGKYRIPIVLDFDYTCTKKSSWLEGTWEENPHCFDMLKKWQGIGCVYVLDTMRGKDNVRPAVEWLENNGISLYGIGRNPDQDSEDYCSRKAWGIFSVDDRNVGSFLIYEEGERPYIDWLTTDFFLTPILEKIANRLVEMDNEIIEESKTNCQSVSD